MSIRQTMLSSLLLFPAAVPGDAGSVTPKKPIPVILHTDIGTDIDDAWALAFLLRCPELDLRLVLVDAGDPVYRARVTARMLEAAGRADVPIALGLPNEKAGAQTHLEWVRDYDLAAFPGKVHKDGAAALVDIVMGSSETICLLSIGPTPALAEALRREPRIAQKARFVGMHGSLRLGYEGSPKPQPEWNVAVDPPACRAVFTAPWPMTITPLDTCGLVRLRGRQWERVRNSRDPLVRAVLENYRIWLGEKKHVFEETTSVLFDTVAVYLVFADALLNMEELGVRVTDDGMTLIDPAAKKMRCATSWKDLDAFGGFLVERLTGKAG